MKPFDDTADQPDAALERLISRALDNELTPVEREAFEARLAQDPAAARCYDELAGVDALVGQTIRCEMASEPTPVKASASPWWRTFGVAAAACIAALMYFGERPVAESREEAGRSGTQAGVLTSDSIWADAQVDGLEPVDPEVFDRLRAGVQDVDRNWVIIPSDKPGEYLLIEVSRVRTEAYALHADF